MWEFKISHEGWMIHTQLGPCVGFGTSFSGCFTPGGRVSIRGWIIFRSCLDSFFKRYLVAWTEKLTCFFKSLAAICSMNLYHNLSVNCCISLAKFCDFSSFVKKENLLPPSIFRNPWCEVNILFPVIKCLSCRHQIDGLEQAVCSYEWKNHSAERDNCPPSLYGIPASLVVRVTIKIAAAMTWWHWKFFKSSETRKSELHISITMYE